MLQIILRTTNCSINDAFLFHVFTTLTRFTSQLLKKEHSVSVLKFNRAASIFIFVTLIHGFRALLPHSFAVSADELYRPCLIWSFSLFWSSRNCNDKLGTLCSVLGKLLLRLTALVNLNVLFYYFSSFMHLFNVILYRNGGV